MGKKKYLIKDYPPGSDITIMETYYSFPSHDDGDGSYVDDFLILIYKNNQTGKHGYEIIHKPDYTFYVLNEGEKIPDHPLFFIEKEKVHPVTTHCTNLERKVAEEIGEEDLYRQNMADHNKEENKKFLMDPRVFWTDVNIEDHYRFLFSQNYTNNIVAIRKAFFDIEVDTKLMSGDFVESGECPVNMISFHDEYHNMTISYILRNPNNPLIYKFEDDVNNGKFTEQYVKDFVRENVGGWKQETRFGLKDTKYELRFYDNELEMIYDFFQSVHYMDPDFIEGWNSSAFDLQYLIDRISALGAIPADIMCNPEFKIRTVKNYIDHRNLNEFAERGDYTFISGYPVWIDQMIQYASRRKANIGSFKSFKLDDIGKDVAGVRKLSYSHITHNIADLPYLDFETFVLYNIMDVVVQKCIEHNAQDIEYMFSKALTNCTSYRKVHRQSVYLTNRMSSDFYKQGYIIGANQNRWNRQSDEKFQGALVGDPLKTNGFSKLKIDGRPIMVSDNCVDFDVKSMYPSIIIQHNIAPNTQIGKIDIPDQVYGDENAYQNDKYSRSGEFLENMVVDNPIEFSKRWFGLAGISEFLDDMKEYSSHYKYGAPYERFKIKDGKVVENPLYDIRYGSPIVNTNKPIYKLSNLQQNGLTTDYGKLIEGEEDNGTGETD